MWKDYSSKSVLILVFGRIGATVEKLDNNSYGVLLTPYDAFVITGTLDEAKKEAEEQIVTWMAQAIAALPMASKTKAVRIINSLGRE